MAAELLNAPRHLRSKLVPTTDFGVYALFLTDFAAIPEFLPGPEGLLYIGKASGSDGFVGRCHFTGRTLNHSPRKSLSVLLLEQLALEIRGHGGRKWGLTQDSDRRLSDWMMHNLCIAFRPVENPEVVERKLIDQHAPPLNLQLCPQNAQHRRISSLRHEAEVKANTSPCGTEIRSKPRSIALVGAQPQVKNPASVDVRIDTAPEIARRYHIDPKRFRGELRKRKFRWHSLWGSWDVTRHTTEWRQMIAVAQELSGLNLGEID